MMPEVSSYAVAAATADAASPAAADPSLPLSPSSPSFGALSLDPSSKFAPLKIVLHPAGPRNCVNFVSDLAREPDVAKRNSSLVMFEHFPGARVHEVGSGRYCSPRHLSHFESKKRYCPPRHPTHFEPSLFYLNGII